MLIYGVQMRVTYLLLLCKNLSERSEPKQYSSISSEFQAQHRWLGLLLLVSGSQPAGVSWAPFAPGVMAVPMLPTFESLE